MRPRRILLLAPQPFFRLRGMCLAVRSVIRAWTSLGARVDVLCYPFGERVDLPEGARVIRLPAVPGMRDIPIGPSLQKVLMAPGMLLAASAMLFRNRYCVVHAGEESAFLAALLKPLFGFSLIYDMDDVLSRRIARSGAIRSRILLRPIEAIETWMIRRADVVLTNSADTTRFARAGHPRRRVVFYDHAPPMPESPREKVWETRARRSLNLNHHRMVLYAGNLEPYQGTEILIDSLPRVLAGHRRTCYVFIGGGKPQIERLRTRARRLGVESSIRWLGKKGLGETFRFMRMADVLISPMTQQKAVPMKLYAYLQAGSPIVATNLPNHTQLLDRRTAVLVPPEPSALAEGIVGVLKNPNAAAQMARRASRRHRMRFREEPVIRALREACALLAQA